jgi:hypothetical protein
MLLILLPASIASSTPFFVNGTSTQPVNRFFSFHSDSPCLIRIKAASPEIDYDMALRSFTIRKNSAPKFGLDAKYKNMDQIIYCHDIFAILHFRVL